MFSNPRSDRAPNPKNLSLISGAEVDAVDCGFIVPPMGFKGAESLLGGLRGLVPPLAGGGLGTNVCAISVNGVAGDDGGTFTFPNRPRGGPPPPDGVGGGVEEPPPPPEGGGDGVGGVSTGGVVVAVVLATTSIW